MDGVDSFFYLLFLAISMSCYFGEFVKPPDLAGGLLWSMVDRVSPWMSRTLLIILTELSMLESGCF